jgi:hypothetical protein
MFNKRIAIIGTSGRNDDVSKLTPALFNSMQQKTLQIITTTFGLDVKNTTLVSGGAAWADHVAVKLFNDKKVQSLHLHLPCKWTGVRHLETVGSWQVNPGRLANQCHFAFSRILGIDTLNEIEIARCLGATVKSDYKGFHDRNNAVANVDYLIAFTWSQGNCPEKGGTLDTWKKAKNAIKIHIPLHF